MWNVNKKNKFDVGFYCDTKSPKLEKVLINPYGIQYPQSSYIYT